ncbi:TetR/AcrR family transcriptional regulator [Acidovorax sp. A1169]|uniref:TetR/AcrR family transcriptional regulator n=1 Tax=Acidovorax sp. A1169 TaxID=3059524 RepID=UPI002737C6FF|nr:TetR/AcrR family transcriptional regulator [Acidovorax sp. A1169]MDP4072966.1 TetR/AcrR family transcriptional regulator [Acidovorax sp. A1169]
MTDARQPSPAPTRRRPEALSPPTAAPAAETAAKAPTASRLLKEQGILTEAENHFAQFGFEGASLESIAAAIGISRHNLLYYFPNKEALYQRVLDDVLTQWLAGMEDLSHSDDPQQALRRYIRAKLRYSRERPNGAKVFTKEVIAGAPRYGKAIAARVGPLLKAEVRTFERWAREGRIARVNFTHLMFIIWSVTQAYAEQEAQFALLLGKPALTERDYGKAEELICRMVIKALEPDAALDNPPGAD